MFNYNSENTDYYYSFYFNLVSLGKFEKKIVDNFKKYFTDFNIDYYLYDENNDFNYCLIISHTDPKSLVKLCYAHV